MYHPFRIRGRRPLIFVEILLPVLVVVACGFVLARFLGAVPDALAKFALFIAVPALLVRVLTRNPPTGGTVGRLFLFMLVYTAAMWLLAEVFGRLRRFDERQRRALILTTAVMNFGNYGLPLVTFAYGVPAVPFSILFFIVFNIPMTTWSLWVAAGGSRSSWEGITAALKMPVFHATVVALIMCGLGWTIPLFLDKGVRLLADCAIPVLLVLLGMQMAKNRGRTDLSGLETAVGLRLLAGPLVGWALAMALGFTGLDLKVIVLLCATPSGLLPLLYAVRFDCRPEWTAATVVVTTLLSALTITAVIAVMR